jgi:hypothetical protein
VAAAILGERTEDPDTFSAPVLRVYATLDPSGCGPERPISCGVATFDPLLGGLAPDPAPPGPADRQPFQTPLYVPALPFVMAVTMPPAQGPTVCTRPCPDNVNLFGVEQPLMVLAAMSGERWTTGTLLVTAGDGRSYVVDLGRFGSPDEVSLLRSEESRVKVVRAEAGIPVSATSSSPRLGVWVDHPPVGDVRLTVDPDQMLPGFVVWPGFTPGDTWTVTWQGVLPGLTQRRAALGKLPGGDLYLAVQEPLGASWVPGAFLERPELGIHAADAWSGEGDLALFVPDVDACPIPVEAGESAVPHEARIESILPPDPVLYPGGALRLAVPADPAGDVQKEKLRCLSDLLSPGQALLSTATIRAHGLVLLGASTGYAGRPRLEERYDLAWRDESGLAGEALVLSRKARRFYYPAAAPCRLDTTTGQRVPGCYSGYPEMSDPLQPGPVIGFRVGTYCPDVGSCPGTLPARGMAVLFGTQSGVIPMSRQPYPLSQGTAVVPFDKTTFPEQQTLGSVFYIAYSGDSVYMVPPSLLVTSAKTIR